MQYAGGNNHGRPGDGDYCGTATVALRHPAHGTATMIGTPQDGSTLVFSAYARNGEPAVFTPEDLAFATADNPITVTGPGAYDSADATFWWGRYDCEPLSTWTHRTLSFDGRCCPLEASASGQRANNP